MDLAVGHPLELGLGRQAIGDDLALDPLDVQAATVVLDLDDDVAALVERVERNDPGLGVSFMLYFFARLNTYSKNL